MKRVSLECSYCHSSQFEVEYVSGSCDLSWQIELACQECGRVTLIAVTKNYNPGLDCVNESRDFYEPTKKREEGGC